MPGKVVVPGYTERYSDSLDPESSAIPVCTVKSFPYKVLLDIFEFVTR